MIDHSDNDSDVGNGCGDVNGDRNMFLIRTLFEISSTILTWEVQGSCWGGLCGVAQYVISVPEGLSRLALEHHARPSSRCAAAFVTRLDPSASVRDRTPAIAWVSHCPLLYKLHDYIIFIHFHQILMITPPTSTRFRWCGFITFVQFHQECVSTW